MTKFLGLENLKQKEEICKTIYSEWSKKLVSNTNNISDLKNKNEDYFTEIETLKNDIVTLETRLTETESKLKKLENERDVTLKSRNDVDQELIKLNPDTLKFEISELEEKKQQSQNYADDVIVVFSFLTQIFQILS